MLHTVGFRSNVSKKKKIDDSARTVVDTTPPTLQMLFIPDYTEGKTGKANEKKATKSKKTVKMEAQKKGHELENVRESI